MVRFSKVNKKFISHFTRAQRTSSEAANVQSFSCATSSSLLMLIAGPVTKMASQQEKAFCALRFEVSRSVITEQREFRARFRKDAPCMVLLDTYAYYHVPKSANTACTKRSS